MWKYYGSIVSGNICSFLGKFIDARAFIESAFSLWDPMYRTRLPTQDDSYVQGLMHLSCALLCLGFVDQARLRRDEALTEARRNSPYTLAFAQLLAWHGDWAMGG
jgi:hypothetical protein